MKVVLAIALGLAALAGGYQTVGAQEACQAARSSCSQMNASCEQKCQAGNNPSVCVARLCSVPFSGCKANGIWKSASSPTCLKTNNRS
ncbi:hypothetical protein [Bosea beijingensis]|uniref:hypothetical protein n=1 Tax=Bosea beijingensis TaxID=3068632 RepID=UPI0027416432|nr:hypothetical protein [Bosea sp. REN20]